MGADYYTIKKGSANCFPFWIEGGSKTIGKKTDAASSPFKSDVFIWLTQENVTCGTDATTGKVLKGYAQCKYTRNLCNAAKIKRLGTSDTSASMCVGTLTWKKR